MSGLARLDSNGGGDFGASEPWLSGLHAQRLREVLDIQNLYLQRNVPAGGTGQNGIDASATGDVDLLDWLPIEIDNTDLKLTSFSDANGSTLIARFRFMVRVSNAAINVTPKLRRGTAITNITTAATITGQVACAATDADYSGTNQYQMVLVAVPTGITLWKPQITIAGTPAAGYQVWARALFDLFVQPA